jgi:hypothetical protein
MKSKLPLPEIAWLTAAVLSFATALHSSLHKGIRESLLLYLILALSLFMFFLRRQLRLRKNSSSTP